MLHCISPSASPRSRWSGLGAAGGSVHADIPGTGMLRFRGCRLALGRRCRRSGRCAAAPDLQTKCLTGRWIKDF